jgi:hypothetical protein
VARYYLMDGFLQKWRAELKKMNKGRKMQIIAASHHTCVSTFITTIRRHSFNDISILGRSHKIVPNFTTIWQGVISTNINLDPKVNKKKKI